MTHMQKAIIFLNFLGIGLFSPILSLFLLDHGCDMRSLSIAIGAYSAAVIVSEVPSGMFADLRGRKNAYLISAMLTFASFTVMYFSRSLPVLIPGIILYGVGAAFLSGSLDSLIIEDCIRRKGDCALAEVTGALLICQCGGIACGALLCAALPNTDGYLLHIVVRLSILLLAALLCGRFLPKEALKRQGGSSFGQQTRMVASALRGRGALQIVMFCIFGSSVSLFALETYWQPQFSAILPERQSYMLGILCAIGYAGNLLGSFLAGRMKLREGKKRWRCYLLCTAGLGCGLGCLALQSKAAGFMLCYVLVMTLLGIANVPEQTILNGAASDETRASLLSVASLSSKISGIFGSAICAALVVRMEIRGVWLLMGGCTALVAMVAAVSLKRLGYEKP